MLFDSTPQKINPIELSNKEIFIGVGNCHRLSLEIINKGPSPLSFLNLYGSIYPDYNNDGSIDAKWWQYLMIPSDWDTIGTKVLFRDGDMIDDFTSSSIAHGLYVINVEHFHSIKIVIQSQGTINTIPKDHAIVRVYGFGY